MKHDMKAILGESFTSEMFDFMEAKEVIFIPKYEEAF
jgi:hypothetical protein